MKQSAFKLETRRQALMPGGVPRWIRVYDDGCSGDRYTVVYTGAAVAKRCGGDHPYRSMSEQPYHPQGVCLMGFEHRGAMDTLNASGYCCCWPPAVGRSNWLGKRITFQDLPDDCKRVVLDDYDRLWELKPESKS